VEMRLFSPDFAWQYFKEKADLYRKYGYDILEERRRFLSWLERLPEPVLEIGTGRGYFTLVLGMQGYNVISIDPDFEAVEFAKSLLSSQGEFVNVDLLIGSGDSIPLPNRSVGSVVMFNLWHHLEDVDKLISEIGRVIRPGGTLAVVDFSQAGFDLVDKIHQEVYGKSHLVVRQGFDDLISSFTEARIYRYKTDFEEGVCLIL